MASHRVVRATARQIEGAIGIPARTIRWWARNGDIRPLDQVLVGTRWAARYDVAEVMRVRLAEQRDA